MLGLFYRGLLGLICCNTPAPIKGSVSYFLGVRKVNRCFRWNLDSLQPNRGMLKHKEPRWSMDSCAQACLGQRDRSFWASLTLEHRGPR